MAAADVAVASSPFHAGERKMHELAGSRSTSEQLGRKWIRPTISAATAAFLAKQPFLFIAAAGEEGLPWASVLVGEPGFLTVPDEGHLRISPLHSFYGDAVSLAEGSLIGTVAIELHTRKRERINGRIIRNDGDSLTIEVHQSFSGCPKYIQGRQLGIEPELLSRVGIEPRPVASHSGPLQAPQLDVIARSDTFFLASFYADPEASGEAELRKLGYDVSHRGGPAGFVQVATSEEGAGEGRSIVQWADYLGNYTFTTLGNIYSNPKVGLIFVDIASGDVLQLSGEAAILFDDHKLPGAERTISVLVDSWRHVSGALPIRTWGEVSASPYNPTSTYQWSEEFGKARIDQLEANYVVADPSRGVRCKCLSVRQDSHNVKTYQLEAPKLRPDKPGGQLYGPGQYVSIDFDGPEHETLARAAGGVHGVVNRTWTISEHPADALASGAITITVKKAGLVSSWLWDNFVPGRTVTVRGIEGTFTPDDCAPDAKRVLLIAGGIGITPLRVMFHEYLARGVDVALIYSVRELEDAVFLEELAAAAAKSASAAKVSVTVTQGRSGGSEGAAMPVEQPGWVKKGGRVSAGLIREVVPDVCDRAVFLCGPTGMREAAEAALEELGFPMGNVHQESFLF